MTRSAPKTSSALLLATVLALTACAAPSLPVTPSLPSPPAHLLNDSSPSVEAFSARARAWLEKVCKSAATWTDKPEACANGPQE